MIEGRAVVDISIGRWVFDSTTGTAASTAGSEISRLRDRLLHFLDGFGDTLRGT